MNKSPERTPLFSSPEDVRAFAASLSSHALGRTLIFHAEVGSTNDAALRGDDDCATYGPVVVADAQTAGRGRRGRRWLTPPNSALTFSFSRPARFYPPQKRAWAALAVGLAVAEAAGNVASAPLRLKWPNDIVQPSPAPPLFLRKLGGVLCEATATRFLFGVGLNVNQTAAELPTETKIPAASLRTIAGKPFARRLLLANILARIESRLNDLDESTGISRLRLELDADFSALWKNKVLFFRRPPEQQDLNHEALTGRFAGLDEWGRLLIRRTADAPPVAAWSDAELLRVEMETDAAAPAAPRS